MPVPVQFSPASWVSFLTSPFESAVENKNTTADDGRRPSSDSARQDRPSREHQHHMHSAGGLLRSFSLSLPLPLPIPRSYRASSDQNEAHRGLEPLSPAESMSSSGLSDQQASSLAPSRPGQKRRRSRTSAPARPTRPPAIFGLAVPPPQSTIQNLRRIHRRSDRLVLQLQDRAVHPLAGRPRTVDVHAVSAKLGRRLLADAAGHARVPPIGPNAIVLAVRAVGHGSCEFSVDSDAPIADAKSGAAPDDDDGTAGPVELVGLVVTEPGPSETSVRFVLADGMVWTMPNNRMTDRRFFEITPAGPGVPTTGPMAARWVQRRPSGAGQHKYVFSPISATSRRHPVVATLDRFGLTVKTEYRMPLPEGGADDEPVQTSRKLIVLALLSSVWLVRREGWPDGEFLSDGFGSGVGNLPMIPTRRMSMQSESSAPVSPRVKASAVPPGMMSPTTEAVDGGVPVIAVVSDSGEVMVSAEPSPRTVVDADQSRPKRRSSAFGLPNRIAALWPDRERKNRHSFHGFGSAAMSDEGSATTPVIAEAEEPDRPNRVDSGWDGLGPNGKIEKKSPIRRCIGLVTRRLPRSKRDR